MSADRFALGRGSLDVCFFSPKHKTPNISPWVVPDNFHFIFLHSVALLLSRTMRHLINASEAEKTSSNNKKIISICVTPPHIRLLTLNLTFQAWDCKLGIASLGFQYYILRKDWNSKRLGYLLSFFRRNKSVFMTSNCLLAFAGSMSDHLLSSFRKQVLRYFCL